MSRWNPATILFDSAKKALAVITGQTIAADQPGLVIAGREAPDKARFVKTDSDGRVHVNVDQSALPAGGATESTLSALTTLAGAIFTRLGDGSQHTIVDSGTVVATQGAMPWAVLAAATDVVLASIDALLVSIRDTAGIKKITDPVTVVQPSAPALNATVAQGGAAGAAGAWAARLSDGAAFYDATRTGQLPVALVGGRLDVNTGAWLGSTAPSVGQKVMAASVPVALASDQSTLAVKEARSATATLANIASSIVSQTLLAANAGRLGGVVYNDSTRNLLLKYGAVASASSFTLLLMPGNYHELVDGYTGQIDGVWAAANGFARVTELTA